MEYNQGDKVQHIKTGVIETVVCLGKMKTNGEWQEAIIYEGKDRFTGTETVFVKSRSEFEKEILDEVNALGVGPMGFGGKTTALAVKINAYPCHIASLPVAINIQCHAARHKSIIL